jgi:hypothetical protein
MTIERRKRGAIRRDLNDVIRDTNGRFSLTKVMSYFGQGLAGYLLLKHAEYALDRWDSLLVILCVMVMPDMLKRIISSKYPVPK